MEAKLHNVSQLRHLPPKVEQLIASHDSREGCWVWHGKTSRWGYGAVRVYYVDGTDGYSGAHRIVYVALAGPIPDGLDLDHLCRNRLCCNPEHLEPVSRRANTLRGEGPAAVNAKKTHCPRGHELTEDNLIPANLKQGGRACLACHRDRRAMPRRLRERAA